MSCDVTITIRDNLSGDYARYRLIKGEGDYACLELLAAPGCRRGDVVYEAALASEAVVAILPQGADE